MAFNRVEAEGQPVKLAMDDRNVGSETIVDRKGREGHIKSKASRVAEKSVQGTHQSELLRTTQCRRG